MANSPNKNLYKKILKYKKESKGSFEKDSNEWFINTYKNKRDRNVVMSTERFTPGKIYVFNYFNPKTKDKLPWWDTNPVVLSLGYDRETQCDLGINLNLMTRNFRVFLLNKVWNVYNSQILYEIEGKFGFKEDAKGQSPLNNFSYEEAKRFLKQYGFTFAIRKYKQDRRTKPSIVSYENWHKIAMANLVDINGGNIAQIYKLYTEHRKNNK